jgi:hypothetical protein
MSALLAPHPLDHQPAGVYDAFGKELSHRHVREAHASILGPHVMDLAHLASLHAKEPEHPVHAKLQESVNGRLSGLWRLEKYDAPIEWYAYRLAHNLPLSATVTDKALEGFDFHAQPDAVKIAADTAMKRNHRAVVEQWRDQEFENLFLNTGINALWNMSVSGTGTANTSGSAAVATAAFNNAQARICVGDSTTAAAATQTWLIASVNKYCVGMDATYPVLSGGGGTSTTYTTQTFRATFTGTVALYAWQEFCCDNENGSNATSSTTTGGSSLDRVVSSQGKLCAPALYC